MVTAALAAVAGWLLAALLLLRLAKFLWNMARLLWLSRNIPGPPPFNAVIGNILGYNGPPDIMLDKVTDEYRRYGSPWRLWIGPILCIFIGEPEDLEVTLTHPSLQDKASEIYEGFKAVLGSGLITLNGPNYRRHRRAVSPAFRIKALRTFIPIFNRLSTSFCRDLEHRADTGEVFNSMPLFTRVTVTTACEAILCMESAGLEAEVQEEVAETFPEASEMMMYLVSRPWFWNRLLRRLSSRYGEYRRVFSSVDRCVRIALERKLDRVRRKISSGRRSEDLDAGGARSVRSHSLVDHILTSEDCPKLDREELLDELKNICGGLIGTGTDLLSFLAIVLSLNPQVQEAMYQELVSVLGADPSRGVTAESVERLEYTERVLLECLRLFPAVPAFARHAKEDIQLPSGAVVPRDTIVCFTPRATHTDERWFPDPFRFDPDRFLPENSKKRPKYSFIPFSLGSRSCIGKNFGKLYVKCVFATLIRTYRLLPDPQGPQNLRDVKTVFGVSLHPADGANVRLERRRVQA